MGILGVASIVHIVATVRTIVRCGQTFGMNVVHGMRFFVFFSYSRRGYFLCILPNITRHVLFIFYNYYFSRRWNSSISPWTNHPPPFCNCWFGLWLALRYADFLELNICAVLQSPCSCVCLLHGYVCVCALVNYTVSCMAELKYNMRCDTPWQSHHAFVCHMSTCVRVSILITLLNVTCHWVYA